MAMARRAAAALCLLGTALADEYAHRYKEGEVVNLWVNKVGPYHTTRRRPTSTTRCPY